MDSVKETISKVLSHAYDPVKAHEYYMRTRELKGRDGPQAPDPSSAKSGGSSTQSTQQNSDYNRMQAQKDSMHRVIDGKLADIENAMKPVTGKDGKKPKLYSNADRLALKKLTEERKAKLEAIANDLYNEKLRIGREQYAKLEAVPEVPKGLGIIQTRRLAAIRAEKIAKIKGDAQTARINASNKAAGLRGEVIAKAISQKVTIQQKAKQAVASKVAGAVNGEYEKLKQDLARLLGRQ